MILGFTRSLNGNFGRERERERERERRRERESCCTELGVGHQ